MRDTIDMAREAGGRAQQNKNCDVEYLMSADGLKAFEALVRADAIAGEREACAEVCDELHWPWLMGDDIGPKECAAAIRARGNT
jgi:hypothetical protein